MSNYIKNRGFLEFLKRVNTGGIIQNCVLKFNYKECNVEAIDESNTLIVHNTSEILDDAYEDTIGLGNIEIITKFLSTIDSKKIKLQVKDNRLILSKSNNKRKLNYLLSDLDAITTLLVKDNPEDNPQAVIMDFQKYQITLKKEIVSDFQSYISMNESKEIRIKFSNKKEKAGCSIIIGEETGHQFTIVIPSENVRPVPSKKKTKEFSMDSYFDGVFFQKVFSLINFDDENPAYLYLSENNPVAIVEGETFWAINPLVEES